MKAEMLISGNHKNHQERQVCMQIKPAAVDVMYEKHEADNP
jgi:hypothetical protein